MKGGEDRMNGKTEGELIDWAATTGLLILLILFLFIIFRFAAISPSFDDDDFCRLEYGENWEHDYIFGHGDTCVEIDYVSRDVINRTDWGMTGMEAIDKYCDYPGFWELDKWEGRCDND